MVGEKKKPRPEGEENEVASVRPESAEIAPTEKNRRPGSRRFCSGIGSDAQNICRRQKSVQARKSREDVNGKTCIAGLIPSIENQNNGGGKRMDVTSVRESLFWGPNPEKDRDKKREQNSLYHGNQ